MRCWSIRNVQTPYPRTNIVSSEGDAVSKIRSFAALFATTSCTRSLLTWKYIYTHNTCWFLGASRILYCRYFFQQIYFMAVCLQRHSRRDIRSCMSVQSCAIPRGFYIECVYTHIHSRIHIYGNENFRNRKYHFLGNFYWSRETFRKKEATPAPHSMWLGYPYLVVLAHDFYPWAPLTCIFYRYQSRIWVGSKLFFLLSG